MEWETRFTLLPETVKERENYIKQLVHSGYYHCVLHGQQVKWRHKDIDKSQIRLPDENYKDRVENALDKIDDRWDVPGKQTGELGDVVVGRTPAPPAHSVRPAPPWCGNQAKTLQEKKTERRDIVKKKKSADQCPSGTQMQKFFTKI